jgi:hypothetical protein
VAGAPAPTSDVELLNDCAHSASPDHHRE